MDDIEKLKEFARTIIEETCWRGGEIDGGTVQEWAEKAGLIKPVPYDPEIHAASYEAEPGDPWFVFAGPLEPRV